MTRVLIGGFGKIVRLGFEDLLEEEGMDLVANARPGVGLMHRLVETLPDVVVLDLDDADSDENAREISHTFPSVTVIECSSSEPTMRVFPAFHRGEFYETGLSPKGFVEAIKSKR